MKRTSNNLSSKNDDKTKINEYFNKQNIHTKNTSTYLHHAVKSNEPNIDIIELLLQLESIDINQQDNNGQTALIIACNTPNSQQIISTLLKYKCNIHIKDHSSNTALFYAVSTWRDNPNIIDLLITNCTTNTAATPLQNAVQQQDEETISMLLCYNADVRPFFVRTCTDYVRELMYPFVNVCDLDVLRWTDLGTLYDMWWCVDKIEFAEWCAEQEDTVLLVAAIFSMVYKPHMGLEVFSRMLYVFFSEVELSDFMYQPVISECILNLLPQLGRYYLDDSDMADILRILLSNSCFIRRSVVVYLEEAFRNPANIIAVLEDFNVTVNDDVENEIDRNHSLLWRMYLSRNFNVGNINAFEVVDELLTLSKFYNFNLNVDNNVVFPHWDCTLLELSRNKIRTLCKANVVDNKPFEYAIRIKTLPIPKILQNVVLLRLPLYQRSSLYIRRKPNYSARW